MLADIFFPLHHQLPPCGIISHVNAELSLSGPYKTIDVAAAAVISLSSLVSMMMTFSSHLSTSSVSRGLL